MIILTLVGRQGPDPEKNSYLQTLFLKLSTLAQDSPLSNKCGATAMDLVNEFESADQIA